MHSAYPIALLLFALLGACLGSSDFDNVVKNSLTDSSGDRKSTKVGEDQAIFGVQQNEGNPFYYVECGLWRRVDFKGSGFRSGCERKWKPLFYACIAGGGVLAALLLGCCCCCCYALGVATPHDPENKPDSKPTSQVIIVNSEVPQKGCETKQNDVPMLAA